jgi:DNA primase
LVLVEGVFDAMAVERAGFAAVALHGKSLSKHLVKFFLTTAKKYSKISIMLDTDALAASFKIRNQLLSQRAIGICAYPPGRDPAEMQPEEIQEIVK